MSERFGPLLHAQDRLLIARTNASAYRMLQWIGAKRRVINARLKNLFPVCTEDRVVEQFDGMDDPYRLMSQRRFRLNMHCASDVRRDDGGGTSRFDIFQLALGQRGRHCRLSQVVGT